MLSISIPTFNFWLNISFWIPITFDLHLWRVVKQWLVLIAQLINVLVSITPKEPKTPARGASSRYCDVCHKINTSPETWKFYLKKVNRGLSCLIGFNRWTFISNAHIRVLMARRADNCLQYSRINMSWISLSLRWLYRGILILSQLFMRPNVCSTGSLALVLLDRCAAPPQMNHPALTFHEGG